MILVKSDFPDVVRKFNSPDIIYLKECAFKDNEIGCLVLLFYIYLELIEGPISHLKHDHRMLRNYLKGTAGDKINTLLAASAYNMMKWMRMKREEILFFLFGWLYREKFFAPVNIPCI